MRRSATLVTLIMLAAGSVVSGQTLRQTPIGARPIGLGGTFVGISDDANAVFWNPAGTSLVQRQELRFTRADRYGLGLNDNNISLIVPILDNHAVGVDVNSDSYDDGELGWGKLQGRFAYGYRYKGLALGAEGKYVRTTTDLDGTSIAKASGFGIDGGVLLSLGRGVRLGFVARDVTNTPMTDERDVSEPVLRRSFAGGISLRPGDNSLLAADIDDKLHVGVEYWPASVLGLRGGVQRELDASGEDLSNSVQYALGASLRFRFLQVDYAYDRHPVLPATHYMTVSLLRSPSFVSIKGASLRPPAVMKSVYRYYQREDFADVVLKNAAQDAVDATVSIYVPNLMDTPYEERVSLPPQTIKSYTFKVAFSDTLLMAQTAGFDNTVQPTVRVSYTQENVPKRTDGKMQTVFIAGKNKMQWRDTRMAAAFVTIDDPAVDRFARGTVARYAKFLRERYGYSNVSKACLLFDALGAYGIRYQIDRSTPWDAVSADSTAFDTIQYPGELFMSKIGDCDDLTVMFAALLGNLGIDTAFLEGNDPAFPHIFLMFDSGIDPNSVADHFLDDSEYVSWNGKVWIPVETTMLTAFPFIDAWRRGREEYNDLKPRGLVKETHVFEASLVYPPGKVKPVEIELPTEEAVDKLFFNRDSSEFDRRMDEIASRLAVSLEDADGLYEAGAYYMRIGRLDKALTMMDQTIAKDPAFSDAINAKGVIYTRRGDYDRALEFFNKALALAPDETGFRVNIALVYYLKNEPEKVREEARRLEGSGFEDVVKDYIRQGESPQARPPVEK